jgi:choline kinase
MNHAIILLAGFGSRLKPLTDSTHKALIDVGGKTILERQLEGLSAHGVTDFHLVLGHRTDDIRAYVGKRFPTLKVRFYANEIYERTNTGYSLNLVLRTLKEGFLLLDGDVVLDGRLLTALCASESGALLCETDPSKLDAEAVKVKVTLPFSPKNGMGTISDIGKHIPLQDAHGESIGVGYYPRDWAEALHACLERELRDEKNWNWYYEDAMKLMLAQKTAPSPLAVIPTGPHPWVEVDDHADLERARHLFK